MGNIKKLILGASILSKLSALARTNDGNISKARIVGIGIIISMFFWLIAIILVIYISVITVVFISDALFLKGESRSILNDGKYIRKINILRGLARIVDYAIIIIPIIPIYQVISVRLSIDVALLAPVSLAIVNMLYFSILKWALAGKTIGGALVGIETTSVVGRLTVSQSVIREVFLIITTIIMYPIVVCVVMKSTQHKHPGDIISNTRVVPTKPAGIAGVYKLFRNRGNMDSSGSDEMSDNISANDSSTHSTDLQDDQTETTLQSHNQDMNNSSPSVETTLQNKSDQGNKNTSGGGTDVWENNKCQNCRDPCPQQADYCPSCGADLSN